MRTFNLLRLAPALLLTISAFGQSTSQSMPQTAKAPTDVKPSSITNDDLPYPHKVSYLPLTLYGQDVRMAYMDVAPTGTPNGRTVVLLHGFNFGGFYFEGPIEALRKEGFRVVVPDQIGFGRSSKPTIPYNFNDMARNTRVLLETLGISKAAIVGHSMGGMLTARFSASYPDVVERAVICNPIGLTDGRWQRPWRTADEAYKATMAQNNDQNWAGFSGTIHRYFQGNAWKPEYDKFIRIMYAPSLSADWPRYAMARAILQQMLLQDPVVYDWPHIKARTLVIGGANDYPEYPAQSRHAAETIPHGELVLIPDVGHVPHIQVPEIFERELLKFLK